jgi:hypothetical protein
VRQADNSRVKAPVLYLSFLVQTGFQTPPQLVPVLVGLVEPASMDWDTPVSLDDINVGSVNEFTINALNAIHTGTKHKLVHSQRRHESSEQLCLLER